MALPGLKPTAILRQAGAEKYSGGVPFSIHQLASVDQCRSAMAQVVRRVIAGTLEVEVGNRLTQMLERVMRSATVIRGHELETRRLDLLGAAVEEGGVVWAGIKIIPPSKHMPTIEGEAVEVELGEPLQIRPPPGRTRT